MNAQACTSPKIKPKPRNTPQKTPEAKAFRKRLRAFRQAIGGNIERIRKADNVPLRTLARKTGYSAVKLDYWEMGRMDISLEAILRIARALKVPHQTLLTTPDTEEVTPAENTAQGGAPKEIPEETPEEAPEEEPAETDDMIDDILLMRLLNDPEVQQVRQMLVREKQGSGYPDADTVEAMEYPLRDVFELSLLFSDLVMVPSRDIPFHMRGLSWLASTLRRDAERLYRLYHGMQPRYD